MYQNNAHDIAKRELRACYGPEGIFAGLHQFKDYWTRDSCYASLGALAIGDRGVVNRWLRCIISYQLPDGSIPLRIGARHMIPKLIGIPQPRIPVYVEDKKGNPNADSAPLLIIAAKAAHASLPLRELERALTPTDTLFREGEYAGWSDSIRRSGVVFFTNLLRWKATIDLAAMHKGANEIEKGNRLANTAHRLRKRINQAFWRNGEFIDWVGAKPHATFPVGEQCLAIHWGFCTRAQSRSILRRLAEHTGLLPPLLNPPPATYLSLPLRLGGMGAYHTRMRWLWTQATYAIALKHECRDKEARDALEIASECILRNGGVHEVYDKNGKPIRTFAYASEHPFAWNAGMFLYASSIVMPAVNHKTYARNKKIQHNKN